MVVLIDDGSSLSIKKSWPISDVVEIRRFDHRAGVRVRVLHDDRI